MFTGIVQATGTIASLGGGRLHLAIPADFAADGLNMGESVAINGCCLTVVPTVEGGDTVAFDLSPETLKRTSFVSLGPGDRVNLERAARLDSLVGGHVVQGHVDATGSVLGITPIENAWIYRFQAPPEYDRYLIDKGSVSIDGISLTVVEPKDGAFDVWIIPHTVEVTNLGDRKPGDPVNLEFDAIAKYVEKLLGSRAA